MNEQEQAELLRLKAAQARLETQLSDLSSQLARFEQRLKEKAQPAPPPTVVKATVPPPLPSPTPARSTVTETRSPLSSVPSQKQVSEPVRPTPPASAISPTVPIAAQTAIKTEEPNTPPMMPAPVAPPEQLSLEMRVGTYWLVRIGVVLLLTGLVFFGNLAYQNYISKLGAGGKVFLLYLTSAILLGAGWWWQRAAVKETLKNYGRVLFAGGLAALYFTTYAAHHVQQLLVIQSATLDGILLLACAGFMVICADRKKSEVMALFAVGLAYYTSIITRVGYFTLYSNLVLTAAGVLFLVRNRWAIVSFGSLVATYAAYGFWRFFDGSNWHWASPAEGLWSGVFFLVCYWLLFTSAVFLSRDEKFAGQNRASFLTLNNGAFFTTFLLTMMQVQEGGFWKFAMIYGATLLGLSVAARVLLAKDPLTANAYLTQGLLLVTAGLITKFAGLQLALMLAVESVILLTLGEQRKNSVLQIGAYVVAGLAVGWGMDGMRQQDAAGVWLAVGSGVFMMVNALLVHRRVAPSPELSLRPQPAYFAALALVVWLAATWNNTTHDHFPVVLACEGLALTFSIYLLRVPEVTLLAQGYMLLAQAAWVWLKLYSTAPMPWWSPLIVLVSSLILSHWWQHQKRVQLQANFSQAWQALYALALVAVLSVWLHDKFELSGWLALTSALAVGLTAYGTLTRTWFIAAFAQIFTALSVGEFFYQMFQQKPDSLRALSPIAALLILSGVTVYWFLQRPQSDVKVREPLLQLAQLYRWVALAMTLVWIWEYVPERQRIWVLVLLGLSVFGWAGLRRNREALWFSGVFAAAALVLFWLPLLESSRVYWPNLCAIIAVLAARQTARRFPDRFGLAPQVHAALIVAAGLSLWRFLSLWVLESASGFYLTASWSLLALALFTAGIVLRERTYRWLGLGILACALGRVLIFDVWKLESLYRILSLMALGIVLLVLGFIYSKYQEKIKEWL